MGVCSDIYLNLDMSVFISQVRFSLIYLDLLSVYSDSFSFPPLTIVVARFYVIKLFFYLSCLVGL